MVHGSDTVFRVETHKSLRPNPPGRFEYRNSSSPSKRTIGRCSATGLLSSLTSSAGPNESPGRGIVSPFPCTWRRLASSPVSSSSFGSSAYFPSRIFPSFFTNRNAHTHIPPGGSCQNPEGGPLFESQRKGPSPDMNPDYRCFPRRFGLPARGGKTCRSMRRTCLTHRESHRPPRVLPRHFEVTDRIIVLVAVPRLSRPCKGPLGPPDFSVKPFLVPGMPHGHVPRFLEGDAGKNFVRLHEQVRDRVALRVEFRSLRLR